MTTSLGSCTIPALAAALRLIAARPAMLPVFDPAAQAWTVELCDLDHVGVGLGSDADLLEAIRLAIVDFGMVVARRNAAAVDLAMVSERHV